MGTRKRHVMHRYDRRLVEGLHWRVIYSLCPEIRVRFKEYLKINEMTEEHGYLIREVSWGSEGLRINDVGQNRELGLKIVVFEVKKSILATDTK
jgi:hypothetical protein